MNNRRHAHYAQVNSHYVAIVFINMNPIVDRFLLIIKYEDIRMPWLEKQTGIEAKRWHSIKQRKVMRTSELEAIQTLYPDYAVWLSTGIEIPEAGHISPMTKRAKRASG